jgi:hypothetical protein
MRSGARGYPWWPGAQTLHARAGYRCARPTPSIYSHSACNARPVHTDLVRTGQATALGECTAKEGQEDQRLADLSGTLKDVSFFITGSRVQNSSIGKLLPIPRLLRGAQLGLGLSNFIAKPLQIEITPCDDDVRKLPSNSGLCRSLAFHENPPA